MQRMAACSMRKDTTIKSCTESKTEALRRAEAKEKFAKQMALFSKYDANKDGVLDKKEIANFAKKEHNFAVPDPAMVLLLKATRALSRAEIPCAENPQGLCSL
ncbi:unnamed protein product [Effrenium voratum]|nr:unnamed protein product [Effrenium voratum]